MSWPKGVSWTKGYVAETGNPDGTKSAMPVHSGPFLFLHLPFTGKRRIMLYAGFRPTPTWGVGYGNEGDIGPLVRVSHYLKNKGWGNLGVALRVEKT